MNATCKIEGCNRPPFDRHGYCGECLNYMDGTYGPQPAGVGQ